MPPPRYANLNSSSSYDFDRFFGQEKEEQSTRKSGIKAMLQLVLDFLDIKNDIIRDIHQDIRENNKERRMIEDIDIEVKHSKHFSIPCGTKTHN